MSSTRRLRGKQRPAADEAEACVRKRPAEQGNDKEGLSLEPPVKKRPAANAATSKQGVLPLALVVSLDRRQDRWSQVSQRLSKFKLLQFERLKAVDGNVDTIDCNVVAESWSTASNWRYVTKIFEGGADCGYMPKVLDLTPGERGCAASHVLAWRRCVEKGAPLMVLEDDAKPMPRFDERLVEALKDLSEEEPSLLYMGYCKAAPWRRRVSARVAEAEYLWTTVGYIVWPAGAAVLLENLPVNQPVDNYMAKLIAERKLQAFAATPALVKQAQAWNVDNDVAHSDDAAWIQNCQ